MRQAERRHQLGGHHHLPRRQHGDVAGGTTISLATPVAAGEQRSYTFSVSLDTSAGNTYQGQRATQPLVWTFTS